MAAHVPPVTNELDALLGYLAQMRYVLRLTAHGLTDDQARTKHPVATLSIGGLLKHVAQTEQYWIDLVQQAPPPSNPDVYADAFTMRDDETLAGVLAAYDDVAARTESVVRGLDVATPVPVPKDAPWFPQDVDAWSVRWVLLHLVTETARHAGHADIVRQTLDGATHFPLLAAAEGWLATPWLQPWQPAAPAR